MSKGAFAFVRIFATSLAVAQTSKPKTSPRLPPAPAVSAPQPQKEQVVEVTEQDFTTLPKIVPTSLSTFGVRLGMTEDEAIAALKSYPQIATGPNEYHRNALRIFVKAGPLADIYFEEGTYAEATRDQQLEAWIQAHIHALEFFGGVPILVVPDNTKTAVTRACRYERSHSRGGASSENWAFSHVRRLF